MQSIIYTDTDRIRSVLGVDDRDLSDSQITARDLEKELRLDLLSWVATHSTLFNAGEASNATESQRSIADALTLYSTYFCSVLVVKSLQISAPQSVSDGKNALNRFSTIDWQSLSIHLQERMRFYKTLVVEQSTSIVTTTVYNPFQGVALSVDPVISAE